MTHRGYVCFDSFRHAFVYKSFQGVKMPSQYCAILLAVNFGIQDLNVHFCGFELQTKKYAKHHFLESDTWTLCAVILVRAQIGVFTVFLQNNIAVFRSCFLYRLVLELCLKHEENSFMSPIRHTTQVHLLFQFLSYPAKKVRTESEACPFLVTSDCPFRRFSLLSPLVLRAGPSGRAV